MVTAARQDKSQVTTIVRCPIAVTHVITTLGSGGAEMMLLKLLGGTDRSRFRSSVIALSGEGPIAERIRRLGVAVTCLNLRAAQPLRSIWTLGVRLRLQAPDVVQTWMYHADLLGALASVAVPRARLVWNIRCGGLQRAVDKRTTIWASRVCAFGSGRIPDRILCCSRAALETHAAAGYARRKLQSIPNGFDTGEFRPDPHRRATVRRELGIGPETLLGGVVARWDRAKDHGTFCAAARIACAADRRIRFVLCGYGITRENSELWSRLVENGVADRCHLLGRRDDIPAIMASLDFAVSASVVEGFPNAIGEAMSSGVPCVATDAGESRVLIGDTGAIVPVRDAAALGAAIVDMSRMDAGARNRLGQKARRRIIEHYSLDLAVRRYEDVYEELATRCVE